MNLLPKLAIVAIVMVAGTASAADLYVASATYGLSCSPSLYGNMTVTVGRACSGKSLCHFTIDHEKHGDPAPMCSKNFVVDYKCSGSNVIKTAAVSAEASKHYVTLDCSQ